MLPCDNAIELVVEDEALMPRHTSIFNKTGRGLIVIGSTSIHVDTVIEPRDYAMDVAVSQCCLTSLNVLFGHRMCYVCYEMFFFGIL